MIATDAARYGGNILHTDNDPRSDTLGIFPLKR